MACLLNNENTGMKKWWDVWWQGSAGYKVWSGFLWLAFASWIFMLVVDPHQRAATQVLGAVGAFCIVIGLGMASPAQWRFLNMTPGQIRESYQMGDGPSRRPQWQRALVWFGFALTVLSQWRACSGV